MNNITAIKLPEMENPSSTDELLSARIIQLAAECEDLKQMLETVVNELAGRAKADALTFQECGRLIGKNNGLIAEARHKDKRIRELDEQVRRQAAKIRLLKDERGGFFTRVRKWLL